MHKERNMKKATWFPIYGVAYAREVSLAALPGADGRYPVTETFSDGIGRATNSLRAVWFNGARDPAYTPLATLTAYPYGTDHLSVMTDPLGVQTVTRTWRADGADVTETVTPGVTNRTVRHVGGATVGERFWDGKWTRETRSTSYGPDGCRAETAVTESSDCPAVTNSVTAYDFLGRVVSVVTPLGVTSNFYDGASSRILRVSRTGQPDTLYAYDALNQYTAIGNQQSPPTMPTASPTGSPPNRSVREPAFLRKHCIMAAMRMPAQRANKRAPSAAAWRPCRRAVSSSSGVGCREPSGPARVVAP